MCNNVYVCIYIYACVWINTCQYHVHQAHLTLQSVGNTLKYKINSQVSSKSTNVHQEHLTLQYVGKTLKYKIDIVHRIYICIIKHVFKHYTIYINTYLYSII